MRIVSVVGARPNFVKLAPVVRALAARANVEHIVVHTGQHYDPTMSGDFFKELEIPPPQYNLEVGSGSHGEQTAAVIARFEQVCRKLAPDWVLVYGDVNSTVAAALAAVKLGTKVAHVEAGLRSYDRSMPEEHNRVLTDHLADLLFTPSRDASDNLRRVGIPDDRVAFIGNVMIDTLAAVLGRARELNMAARLGVARHGFTLVTLHRPSNVDDLHTLSELCEALAELHRRRPVVFPVHPRSRARLEASGLLTRISGVCLIEPLPYIAMLSLMEAAGLVITDSGGVQEETTFLGVPCLTVRPGTERPITVTLGTNRLVKPTSAAILDAAAHVTRPTTVPKLERWDGAASDRLVRVLCDGTWVE